MLSVDAKEQVMLRVTVAEVNRTLMKQMGVNLGAQIASGNFSTSLLTENSLPLTAAPGLGRLPVPGIDDGGWLRPARSAVPSTARSATTTTARRPTLSATPASPVAGTAAIPASRMPSACWSATACCARWPSRT